MACGLSQANRRGPAAWSSIAWNRNCPENISSIQSNSGQEIAPENVASWPTMPDEDLVPVPLEGEPDWMTLNQGSMVEVWLGEKLATRQPALVEAIVGAGAQWTALVRRSDFAADALKNWADKPKLRLTRLPRKPQWSPT